MQYYLYLIISYCDSTDEDLGISREGTFTAKADGEEFVSLKSTVVATITGQIAQVQGSKPDGEYLNYNGLGRYKAGDAISNINTIQYETISPISTLVSSFNIGTGTIEITEDNATNISRTFSFTGVQDGFSNKVIAAGTISAPKN